MLAPSVEVQNLQAARNRIADPDKWCQNSLLDGGTLADPRRVCAVGADLWARGAPDEEWASNNACLPLKLAARQLFGMAPYDVNDFIGHEAVMQMYARAIQLAMSGKP